MDTLRDAMRDASPLPASTAPIKCRLYTTSGTDAEIAEGDSYVSQSVTSFLTDTKVEAVVLWDSAGDEEPIPDEDD